MLFAQGRDLLGQRPDETKAVCRRAGNEVVVPTVRHLVYGCVLPVHVLKVAFLPSDINLMVPPNNDWADPHKNPVLEAAADLLNASILSNIDRNLHPVKTFVKSHFQEEISKGITHLGNTFGSLNGR